MNNKNSAVPNAALSSGYHMATMTPEQQQTVQDDSGGRAHQVSAFAGVGSETGYQMASMTLEQQQMVQDDLADRERQASALAAAGMVAETVGYAHHVGNSIATPPNGQGLHAPPMLGSVIQPANPEPTGTIDGINWSMMDVGMALDDMEMDFANLFDPAHEEASMQMEGSGWPGTNDPVTSPLGDIANS
jgi:hypothetical protein